MLCGIILGAAVGACVAITVFLWGDHLSAIFTRDDVVITRAFEYLRGLAPEAFVTCVLFSLLGYFNGHAKTVFVMCESLARSFIIKLPIAYYMSVIPNPSLTGVALAGPISTTCGIFVCIIYYFYLQRQMRREMHTLTE